MHSHQTHLYALLKMAKQNGVDRVFVHAFMDGRDTLPTNGAGYLEQLQQKMREYNIGKIATVSGRYYAMDRDRRWERIAKAFNAMVFGDGEGGKYADPVQGVKDSYNKDVTDEFIVPFVCTDERGEPLATIRDDDSCICFNFRADRVRADHARPDAQQRTERRKAAAICPAPRISTPPFRAIACRRICTTSA